MSPLEAYGIDSKIDDGKPVTGRIRAVHAGYELLAIGIPNWGAAAPFMSGACTGGGATYKDPGSYYLIDSSHANSPSTGLVIIAPF